MAIPLPSSATTAVTPLKKMTPAEVANPRMTETTINGIRDGALPPFSSLSWDKKTTSDEDPVPRARQPSHARLPVLASFTTIVPKVEWNMQSLDSVSLPSRFLCVLGWRLCVRQPKVFSCFCFGFFWLCLVVFSCGF
jgi:hypothetical protein